MFKNWNRYKVKSIFGPLKIIIPTIETLFPRYLWLLVEEFFYSFLYIYSDLKHLPFNIFLSGLILYDLKSLFNIFFYHIDDFRPNIVVKQKDGFLDVFVVETDLQWYSHYILSASSFMVDKNVITLPAGRSTLNFFGDEWIWMFLLHRW